MEAMAQRSPGDHTAKAKSLDMELSEYVAITLTLMDVAYIMTLYFTADRPWLSVFLAALFPGLNVPALRLGNRLGVNLVRYSLALTLVPMFLVAYLSGPAAPGWLLCFSAVIATQIMISDQTYKTILITCFVVVATTGSYAAGKGPVECAVIFVTLLAYASVLTRVFTFLVVQNERVSTANIKNQELAARLRNSEAQVRAILDDSPVGVSIVTDGGVRKYVNSRYAEMQGRPAAELVGQSSRTGFRHESAREEFRSQYAAHGSVHDWECEMQRADGSAYWALMTMQPTEFDSEPARIAWIYDISERKQAEAYLHLALDNMSDGLFVIDADMKFALFNDRYHQLLAVPAEMLSIGSPVYDLSLHLAESGAWGEGDSETLARARLAALANDQIIISEAVTVDGRIVETRKTPLQAGGCVGVTSDISERKSAETALARQREVLDTTLQAMTQGIIMMDSEFRLRTYNDNFARSFNLANDYLDSQPAFDELLNVWAQANGVTEPDAAKVTAMAHRGEHFSFEQILPDGRIYDCRHSPLADGGFVRTFTNITERKRAEAELAQKEAHLRLALDNMSDGLYIIDRDMNFSLFNERYQEHMGVGTDVLYQGSPVQDLTLYLAEHGAWGEGDPAELSRERLAALGNDQIIVSETLREDGKTLETRKTPLEGGGCVGVMSDITDRKRAEAVLRESEQRANAILNTAFQLQGLLRRDGTLIEANAAALSFIDASKEDVVGLPFWDCPWWAHDPDLQARLREAVKQVAGGKTAQFLATHPALDGSLRDIDFRMTPVRDEAGDVVLLVPEGHDITVLKQAEAALLKQTQVVQLLHNTAASANQSQEIEDALKGCIDEICTYNDWPIGHVYLRRSIASDTLVSADIWHLHEPERFSTFRRVTEETTFERGVGLPGRVLESGKPAWIVDVTKDPNFPRATLADDIGVKAGFGVPVLVGNEVAAVMEFFAPEAIEPDQDLLSVLDNVGTQVGRVIERKQAEQVITKAHSLITESVNYASNIQRSALPAPSSLEQAFADHFVFWEPRDVVGGDFYWLRQCTGGQLLVVCDCTGHGVPGAFMTLIATRALDQALNENPEGDPASILAELNYFVKRALLQDTDEGHADDGMELGICRIDNNRRDLTYAGARFSLVVAEGDEIAEVKGDKTGIGYRHSDPSFEFTNHRIDIASNQTFYLYSDGIVDQIGGMKRRGFGRKRLLGLIAKVLAQPMAEQLAAIRDTLHEYQGEENRRDDVTVVGFKPEL